MTTQGECPPSLTYDPRSVAWSLKVNFKRTVVIIPTELITDLDAEDGARILFNLNRAIP